MVSERVAEAAYGTSRSHCTCVTNAPVSLLDALIFVSVRAAVCTRDQYKQHNSIHCTAICAVYSECVRYNKRTLWGSSRAARAKANMCSSHRKSPQAVIHYAHAHHTVFTMLLHAAAALSEARAQSTLL